MIHRRWVRGSHWAGLLAAALVGGQAALATGEEPATGEKVSFSRDVAPILVKNCLACHGAQEPESEFQLHTYERLLRPGASELPPVTPGDPEDSEVLRLIASEDEAERMPKEADPLPAQEIALLRRWVEEGAHFDGKDATALLSSLIPRKRNPEPPVVYRAPLPITAIAFSASGNELAVGGYHEVTIWDMKTGRLLRRIKDIPQRTYGLAYSPDRPWLAVAAGTPGELGEVLLVEVESGERVASLAILADVALDVRFSPRGDKLAACGADRSIRVFDAASFHPEAVIEDHADWVTSVGWSPDGKLLASASRDRTAKVFDAATGESITTYPGHGEPVNAVAFSADSRQVFSAGQGRVIHIWQVADGQKKGEVAGFGGDVFAFWAEGDRLFACSSDQLVRELSPATKKVVREYSGHQDWVYCLAADIPRGRLAAGAFDGRVLVWNAEDGERLLELIAAPGLVAAGATAP